MSFEGGNVFLKTTKFRLVVFAGYLAVSLIVYGNLPSDTSIRLIYIATIICASPVVINRDLVFINSTSFLFWGTFLYFTWRYDIASRAQSGAYVDYQLLNLLFIFSFSVSSMAVRVRKPIHIFAGNLYARSKKFKKVFYEFYLLYVIINLFLLARFFRFSSIYGMVSSSLQFRFEIARGGYTYFLVVNHILEAVILSLSVIWWRQSRQRKFLYLSVSSSVFFSLFYGSRLGVILPLVVAFIAYFYVSESAFRRRSAIFLVVFAPSAFLVSWFSNFYLGLRGGGGIASSNLLDRFDSSLNAIRYIEKFGLKTDLFSSIYDAPLEFLPRSLFPGKPYYFSTQRTMELYPAANASGINFDFGAILESYWNFGMLGPVVLGLTLALICGWVDNLPSRNNVFYLVFFLNVILIPFSMYSVSFINSAILISWASAFVFFAFIKYIGRSFIGFKFRVD